MSLTKSRLPIQQEVIAPQNCAILPTDIETPNKPTLSVPSVDEIPLQSRLIAELRALAPNKTMLLVSPADKALNQPISTTQLGATSAPNKTMLSALPVDKDEVPNQPTFTTQLGAPAPNKTMLLVLLANEMPNQTLSALFQQDLARVPKTLLAPVP